MDVEDIKTAFGQIQGPDELALKPIIDTLSSADLGSGPLLDYQAGRNKAIFRKDHPVAALYNRSQSPRKVFFLLSALVSVFNRAELSYEDKSERDFHSRLVNYLLQTP